MNTLKMLLSVVLVSGLALAGCEQAEAVEFNQLPLDVTLGYSDNGVIDDEGLRASVGTEYKNVRLGVTTMTSESRLEIYGAYAAVPVNIRQTRLAVVPQIKVEQYREASELVGSLGLGLEYKLTDTLRVAATGFVSEGFDKSDFDGEEYTVGITKTFK